MKKKFTLKLSLVFITVLFLNSCTTSYYQVYRAETTDKMTKTETGLIYEDNNCKIVYNMWSEAGDIGFNFFNKTDDYIYLNLEECFFILNSNANNYYNNRIFSNSVNTQKSTVSTSRTGFATSSKYGVRSTGYSTTTSTTVSSEESVATNEEKIICIPSKTSKRVFEYSINNNLIRNCDLFLYPYASEITTKTFTKTESPVVFENIITYSVGKTGTNNVLKHSFFIADITNYPKNEIVETRYEEFCGEKSFTPIEYIKNASPDKFYIIYTKGPERFRH